MTMRDPIFHWALVTAIGMLLGALVRIGHTVIRNK
jgi:hypothetical protein